MSQTQTSEKEKRDLIVRKINNIPLNNWQYHEDEKRSIYFSKGENEFNIRIYPPQPDTGGNYWCIINNKSLPNDGMAFSDIIFHELYLAVKEKGIKENVDTIISLLDTVADLLDI